MYNQNNQNRPFLPLEGGAVQKPALQRRPHRCGHTPPHRSAPKNRFFRLSSTCRQNRSFVTRRTKPGNSGRLPPRFKAVQAGGSKQFEAVPSVPSACSRVVEPAARSSKHRALHSFNSWLLLSGVGVGERVVRAEAFRSWRFF